MGLWIMSIAYWIHGLWIAQLALEFLLVIVLLAKAAWRAFPMFTAFSVWSLAGDFAGYALAHNPNVYVKVYLIYETVSIGLALALTYEIFVHLLSSHQGLRRLASLSLCIACIFLVVLGAIVILSHSPIGQKGLLAGILAIEEACRVLEVGLIASLFVFSGAFGLHWRRQVFGIVIGLGLSAAVKLANVTMVPKSYAAVGISNLAIIVSYDFSLLIWIAYMLAPERAKTSNDLPSRSQLEQWNRAVMELIHQ
jgi:hypothetical protein